MDPVTRTRNPLLRKVGSETCLTSGVEQGTTPSEEKKPSTLSQMRRPPPKSRRKLNTNHKEISRAISTTHFSTMVGTEEIEKLSAQPSTLDDCFGNLDYFLSEQSQNTANSKRSSNYFSLKSFKKRNTRTVDAPLVLCDLTEGCTDLMLELEEFIQLIYLVFLQTNCSSLSRIYSVMIKILERMKTVTESIRKQFSGKPMEEVFLKTITRIDDTSSDGNPDTVTIEALEKDRASVISNVITIMKRHVQNQLIRIRSFSIQLLGAAGNSKPLIYASIIQSIILLLTEILDTMSTIKELQKKLGEVKSQSTAIVHHAELLGEHIWQEEAKEMPDETGTLNSLISNLTSTTNYDSNNTKSFAMTYRSFTTPWILLQKLKQRFEDIPEEIPVEEKAQIQLRVCILLKYLVETKIIDFDNQLLKDLKQFLAGPVAKANPEMATRLLHTTVESEKGYLQIFETKTLRPFPPKMMTHYLKKAVTQTSLLNLFPTHMIAQQLTLLDYELFDKVEVVGFLQQSWIKKKLQYRALCLVYFIERLDKYSHWVATLIVSENRIDTRVAQLRKLINLAYQLMDVHKNYHAVVGIVTGFNQAPVLRLKHTFNELSKKEKAMLEELNDFCNPRKSFAKYRESLRSAVLPVIPYLGVYLSDLTFIDEGNPDEIDGFINYGKQDMVYNALREVLVYKQSRYEYTPNILLKHYLCALPSLDVNKILYPISLEIEPRGAERSAIL